METATSSRPARRWAATGRVAQAVLLPLGLAAGFAPLAWPMCRLLWSRPHYQFFPVLAAAVGWLAWRRRPRRGEWRGPAGWLEGGFFAAAIGLLASAVVLWYCWLAWLGLIVAVGGLMLHWGGRGRRREMLAAWAPLLLAAPLPMHGDEHLIAGLQRLTAVAASRVLDLFGVVHLMEGTILQLPDRRLFVEEACSGVQSLYAMLALAALLAVVLRRSLVQAALLLAAAAFWAAAGNVVRVALTAAAGSWGVDVAGGWRHEAIGYGVFLAGAAMVASTDALVFLLTAPVPEPMDEEQPGGWAARAWNRWVAGREGPAAWPEEAEDELEDGGEPSGGGAPPDPGSRAGQPGASQAGPRPARMLAAAAASLVLGGVQLVAFGRSAESPLFASQVLRAVQRVAATMDAETLPAEFGDWRRVGFRSMRRGQGDMWGERSAVWTYKTPACDVVVSLDYPFADWHDLAVCYRADGWFVGRRRIVAGRSEAGGSPDPYVEIEMHKPTGEFGRLWFEHRDETGSPLAPGVTPRNILERVRTLIVRNPLWSAILGRRPGALESAVFQFQLLGVSQRPLDVEQNKQLRRCFLLFRRRVVERWREAEGEAGAAARAE